MEAEARPPQDREALRGGQEGPCLPAARPPGQEAKGAQEAGLWPGALPAHAGPATSHWPTGRGHGGGLHLPLQGGALAPAHALASTTHTHTGAPLPGSAPDGPGAPRPAWRRRQASDDPGRRPSHPGARGHTPDACPPAAACLTLPVPAGPTSSRQSARLSLPGSTADPSKQTRRPGHLRTTRRASARGPAQPPRTVLDPQGTKPKPIRHNRCVLWR